MDGKSPTRRGDKKEICLRTLEVVPVAFDLTPSQLLKGSHQNLKKLGFTVKYYEEGA